MGKRNKANAVKAPPDDHVDGSMGTPWPLLLGNYDVAPPEHERIDPDILDLCENFDIDDFRTRKLHGLLMERPDTFEGDMLRLWTDLNRSKNPNTLMNTLIKQLVDGRFVGKTLADPELEDLIKRYKLDEQAEMKLTDVLSRHDRAKRKEYCYELEEWLAVSNKTSATACMLLKKIGAGEPLGPPPRRGPGGKEKGKGGKGRSRSPRRSRSREPQREPDPPRQPRRDSRSRGRDRDYDRNRDHDRDKDERRDGGRDRNRSSDYDRDIDRWNRDWGRDGCRDQNRKDDHYNSDSRRSYKDGGRDSESGRSRNDWDRDGRQGGKQDDRSQQKEPDRDRDREWDTWQQRQTGNTDAPRSSTDGQDNRNNDRDQDKSASSQWDNRRYEQNYHGHDR